MITFLIGLFLGYWIYPARMFWKLYKINRKLVQLELDHMKLMKDIKGTQWNEDKL